MKESAMDQVQSPEPPTPQASWSQITRHRLKIWSLAAGPNWHRSCDLARTTGLQHDSLDDILASMVFDGVLECRKDSPPGHLEVRQVTGVSQCELAWRPRTYLGNAGPFHSSWTPNGNGNGPRNGDGAHDDAPSREVASGGPALVPSTSFPAMSARAGLDPTAFLSLIRRLEQAKLLTIHSQQVAGRWSHWFELRADAEPALRILENLRLPETGK